VVTRSNIYLPVTHNGCAPDLPPDGMLTMKNFSLHDAMMAIEVRCILNWSRQNLTTLKVMDPRMDSGVERPEYPRRQFDPYILLLPEEVCWIMDRMFAAEVSVVDQLHIHMFTLNL
jgi:hypothetical protein